MTSSLLARAFKVSSCFSAIPTRNAAGFTFSRLNSTTTFRRQPEAASLDSSKPEGRNFKTLQGAVSDATYKAIVGPPFSISHMTPVQEEVLSLLPAISEPYNSEATEPRDLLVRAKTGTGKTLAFLIPALEARAKAITAFGTKTIVDSGLTSSPELEARARRRYSRETVGALIISPTRELAGQIATEAMKLCSEHKGMEVRLLTGGVNKRLQMRDWMKGSRDVVVATTGRLRDLMESEPEVLRALKTTSTLILDEADTMLEMGFRDDIDAIQQVLPSSPERQSLLFSATVSSMVRQVAQAILAKNYKYIDCVQEHEPVHTHIPQYHTVVPDASQQIPHVLRLIAHDQLANPGHSKIIVFLPTTKMTQLFATLLREVAREILPAQTTVLEIHSKRAQTSRDNTADRFRKSKTGATVLVTSDVSARGVDYPGVTRVIQVGIPASADQYIHRIGRTGRAGLAGRGDIVLLPWEIGFITWQLTDFPIKPLTTSEMKTQLADLASAVDGGSISGLPKGYFRNPLVPMLDEYEKSAQEIMLRFDADAIKETFMSMLGFYFSRGPELRVQKPIILEGLKDWSTQAAGLEVPPYVSENFLQKIGYTDGRTGPKYGTTLGPGRARRQNSGAAHWIGRGNTKKRTEQWDQPELRSRPRVNYDDPEAREYRHSRPKGFSTGPRKWDASENNDRGGYRRDGGGYGGDRGGERRAGGYRGDRGGDRRGGGGYEGHRDGDRRAGGFGDRSGYSLRSRSSD